MPCKLQLFQKRKKRLQKKRRSTKRSSVCSYCLFTCKLPGAERGNTLQAPHWTLVRVCVRASISAFVQSQCGKDQRDRGPKASAAWSLTSSTPDGEKRNKVDEGGRWLEQVLPNHGKHSRSRHCLTLIRARDASYDPPAHLQPIKHSLINHP